MSTAARTAQAPATTNSAAAAASKAPNADAQSDLDRAALEALELDSDVITSVRLDGLALTKIVKHCRDAHPASASGALLGMDLGGTLKFPTYSPSPTLDVEVESVMRRRTEAAVTHQIHF